MISKKVLKKILYIGPKNIISVYNWKKCTWIQKNCMREDQHRQLSVSLLNTKENLYLHNSKHLWLHCGKIIKKENTGPYKITGGACKTQKSCYVTYFFIRIYVYI